MFVSIAYKNCRKPPLYFLKEHGQKQQRYPLSFLNAELYIYVFWNAKTYLLRWFLSSVFEVYLVLKFCTKIFYKKSCISYTISLHYLLRTNLLSIKSPYNPSPFIQNVLQPRTYIFFLSTLQNNRTPRNRAKFAPAGVWNY